MERAKDVPWINDAGTWLKAEASVGGKRLPRVEPYGLWTPQKICEVWQDNASREPVCWKTHHAPVFWRPEDYRDIAAFYVYRDPRDVVLSLWRFYDDPGTLLDFVTGPIERAEGHSFIHPNGRPRSVLDWYDQQLTAWFLQDDVFFVRYEELVTEPKKVIAGMAAWLETEPGTIGLPKSVVGHRPGPAKIAGRRDEMDTETERILRDTLPAPVFWESP
jgi:hypothetical protein